MMRAATWLLALVFTACSGKSGGSTPQEVFENAKSAAAAHDWKALLKTVDPEKTDMMVFSTVMMAGFTVMSSPDAKKELDQVLKNHGLDPDEKPKITGKADITAAAKESLKNVKDKPALFADLIAVSEKHSKKDQSIKAEFVGATLKDVKIEGDKATATVAKADGKTSPMAFVKRDGAWYLSPPMGE